MPNPFQKRLTRRELKGDLKAFVAVLDNQAKESRKWENWPRIQKHVKLCKDVGINGKPIDFSVRIRKGTHITVFVFSPVRQALKGVHQFTVAEKKKPEAPKEPKPSKPMTAIDSLDGRVTYDVPEGAVPCRFTLGDRVMQRNNGGITETVERIKWVREVWHSLEPYWRIETDRSGGSQVGYVKVAGAMNRKPKTTRCMASCGHMVTFRYVPPARPVCPDYCDACKC